MKTTFYFFTMWLFVVIFFYAIQMVFFHTTTEITTASIITLNTTNQLQVSEHMLRFTDIFQTIMTIFIVGFGIAFLLSAGFDLKKYIGGDTIL